MDQIPHFDRQDFPISDVIDILPQCCFQQSYYKVQRDKEMDPKVSHTSFYSLSAKRYGYVTCLYFFEKLDTYAQAQMMKQEDVYRNQPFAAA